ncbi:MAG: dTDP-4-dehydrorhamnose reductase [Marinirhabdus sp.]|nr:dTDP-4-dehydrorhamnose reductase [Marinirhabdus sp.]
MKNVLVTGANGQLGTCIKDMVSDGSEVHYVFVSKDELSITDTSALQNYFKKTKFDYCINTAAYTQVDQAEKEAEAAYAINAEGVKNLAEVCQENNTTLIHISTDYVFDGNSTQPYRETDATNPINVYGASKLAGERYVENICSAYYILRTSWLYSQYGQNFLKTILKHGKLGTELKITTEQIGTPTNANDLAKIACLLVEREHIPYGVYHFSNQGRATWYDFAKEILLKASDLSTANLAKTDHYRTFAARPKFSVLHTEKLQKALGIQMKPWKERVAAVITILENN